MNHVNSDSCPCEPRDLGLGIVAHLDPAVPPRMMVVTTLPAPAPVCLCGDTDCLHLQVGYPFCRPCEEHHRGPECAIDDQGRALSPDGTPWEDLP